MFIDKYMLGKYLNKGYNIMSDINSSGKYTVKETGETIVYPFVYAGYATLDDAIESLGEAKCLSALQRMIKTDANNTAREKAKTANGHSARIPMSEEEKAEKKAGRQADKALLEALKNNPDLLAQLGM